MRDVFNFSAGPSMLPEEVLLEAQKEMLNCLGSGMSALEMSHRSKTYDAIHNEAIALFKELFNVDDSKYYVLFLQGGATTQFSAVPLNLLTEKNGKKADYIVTGNFASKAYEEACRYGDIKCLANTKESKYSYIPDVDTLEYRENTDYVHITSNNTIFGTRYTKFPNVNNLVADMSSNILSEPVDVNKFKLIYAGAQKNVAPSGLTIVVVRKDAVDNCEPLPFTPILMQYRTQASKDSLYNTPCTYSTYIAMLNFRYLKKFGGVEAIYKQNKYKAGLLYDYLDNSNFYTNIVRKEDRSIMNVTFVTPNADLDAKFVKEAGQNGLVSLKGHKLVGGLRASIYNSMPVEGVEKLISFMKKFEMENK
ncbi:MAG: 3-phosphoserine/phosphohydroxythreonine transaminase [Clostridia bacterium]|nr:3-phosphoserine/phosphohydroxythreonine transaminase [Clostridia bacterium]